MLRVLSLRSSRCIMPTAFHFDGWLVVWGLTALSNSISVCVGPSPREREKEERNNRRRKKYPNNPDRAYCKRSKPLPYYYPDKQYAPTLEVYPASLHHTTTPTLLKDNFFISLQNHMLRSFIRTILPRWF